jgi:hypothetical protein
MYHLSRLYDRNLKVTRDLLVLLSNDFNLVAELSLKVRPQVFVLLAVPCEAQIGGKFSFGITRTDIKSMTRGRRVNPQRRTASTAVLDLDHEPPRKPKSHSRFARKHSSPQELTLLTVGSGPVYDEEGG